MLVIGEKVNVITNKIRAAMDARDKGPIQEMAKIQVDETDLRSWYQANLSRYGGDEAEPRPFDEVRQIVERDYRLMKLDEGYQRLVESELSAAGVELFPERLDDGS